ncbi:MAG: hypothetical protein PVF58_20040, partial [Candidatus Methanofastidiosia archaeon]
MGTSPSYSLKDAQSVIEKIENYGTVKIKKSKKSIFITFFGCLLITTIGISYIIQKGSIWRSIWYLGIGILLLGYTITSMKSYILLSSEGFSIHFVDQRSYKWTDVKGFGAGYKSVFFEFTYPRKNQAILERILRFPEKVHYNRKISCFPDEYNMSPKELADLLNTLREHF